MWKTVRPMLSCFLTHGVYSYHFSELPFDWQSYRFFHVPLYQTHTERTSLARFCKNFIAMFAARKLEPTVKNCTDEIYCFYKEHECDKQHGQTDAQSCCDAISPAQYTPPTPTRRNCFIASRRRRRCVHEFATTADGFGDANAQRSRRPWPSLHFCSQCMA